MANVQVNIILKEETKKELQRIATKRSVERDDAITYLDVIRELIDREIEVSGSLKK